MNGLFMFEPVDGTENEKSRELMDVQSSVFFVILKH